ncbi:MAG: hypothetical protein ACKN95_01365 [Holophagaceae bacterium]|jgi:hypothetical protein
MTINQLSSLAKLLEDASKPNSQSREIKQSPKSTKTPAKTVKKSQIVLDEEKQASLKAQKKTHKYLKRVASTTSTPTPVKSLTPPVPSAPLAKIAKMVPSAVGTSLIQALSKGVVKSDIPNEEETKEPWQSKFQGKQY